MVMRMNDFETVRDELEDYRGNAMADAAWAALDRIEAEVERLQRLADQRAAHIRSESSRLVQIDAARNKAEAEVERLREEAVTTTEKWNTAARERGELRAKVERLRAALEQIEEDPMLGVIPLKNIARATLAKEDA